MQSIKDNEEHFKELFEIKGNLDIVYQFLGTLFNHDTDYTINMFKGLMTIECGKTFYLSRNVTHGADLYKNMCLLGRFDQAVFLMNAFNGYRYLPYVFRFIIPNRKFEEFVECFKPRLDYGLMIAYAHKTMDCRFATWLTEQHSELDSYMYDCFGCVPSIAAKLGKLVKEDVEFFKRAIQANLETVVKQMLQTGLYDKCRDMIMEMFVEGVLQKNMVHLLIEYGFDLYE